MNLAIWITLKNLAERIDKGNAKDSDLAFIDMYFVYVALALFAMLCTMIYIVFF